MVDERSAALRLDDLATFVYTSGTTGRPKGAMLTHGNVTANIEHVTAVVPIGPDDRFLSFLPLSHIAERTVSHFGQVLSGGETWFAQSLASVPGDLLDTRPTIFFAVPRVWEKFREGIREKVERSSAPQRALAETYLDLAARRGGVTGAGEPLDTWGTVRFAALDRVVGRSVRAGPGPRPGPVPRVGGRAGAPGPAPVVRRHRPPDRRGLRADRGLRGHHAEPTRGDPDRHRRTGGARCRGAHRRTTGRSWCAAPT